MLREANYSVRYLKSRSCLHLIILILFTAFFLNKNFGIPDKSRPGISVTRNVFNIWKTILFKMAAIHPLSKWYSNGLGKITLICYKVLPLKFLIQSVVYLSTHKFMRICMENTANLSFTYSKTKKKKFLSKKKKKK